jgi:hypothetical protein
MARTAHLKYMLLALTTVICNQAHAKKITIHNCSANGIKVCLYNTSETVIRYPYLSNKIRSGSSYSFRCQPDKRAGHCASIMLVNDKKGCYGGYYYRNLGNVDHYYYNGSMSIKAPSKCP